MTPSARRLTALRRLLANARDRLGIDVGFVLWDGSTIPDDLASDAIAIAIADEGAIAGLLKRPRLDTLADLWVTKRLDVRNGSLLEISRMRPRSRIRTRALWRALDKRLLLPTLFRFWRLDRGGPWPLEEVPPPSNGSTDGNKQNIGYHYDVSNAFYGLWLDREMVYTCGYAVDAEADIDRMQQDKLEMICRKLRLQAGERLLDLGCGWGALSLYAAKRYGVTAHGVTLSEQQVAHAKERIEREGLEGKVRIELADYTSVEGEFDKVAAIGIQEHVGWDNYPVYYETVRRVLVRDGLFLHHAIARPAKKNDRVFRRKRPEFAMLTKYVFPGGELDHLGNTIASLERHKFEVLDVEAWREHYQRTCRLWHDRLLARYEKAVAEVGEVKTRLWLAYLAGCAIAFERNTVGLYQTLATPRRRGPSGVPATRADLYR